MSLHHLFQSAASSPLGRVFAAAESRDSTGLTRGKMRILEWYALVYALRGEGRYHDARGNRADIRPGDLIVILPDSGHYYGPPAGQTWDEYYICFEGSVFDLWRLTGVLDPLRPVYHLEPVDYWLHRFQEIAAPNLPALERVCRLQGVLADALINYQRDPTAERDEEWLAHARSLLEVNIGEPLYVENVARQLGISYETFRKKFVRLAGISPYRHRLNRIIDQAYRLVHEGHLSNKEIADQLGFSDEFHFSRRFKQITGRSPSQVRPPLLRGKSVEDPFSSS